MQATTSKAYVAVLLLSLLGCNHSQSNFRDLEDLEDLEEKISDFYKHKGPTEYLEVREISGGKNVEGFCVLSAYEDRVTPASDKLIPVNNLLEKNHFLGKEEYWHLIVKTSDGLHIAKLKTTRTPLISPRPTYEGGNCVFTRSIIFSKTLIPTGGTPSITASPRMKTVINIQPGE